MYDSFFKSKAPHLLVHGGQIINQSDKKNKSQADLYLLNVESLQWKRFFVFDQPTARDQHSLTKLGKLYYMYGGNIAPENLLLDEMWCLNLDAVPWSSKQMELPGIVWEKINQKSDNYKTPEKLKGHKIVAHPDGQHLILFGG